MDAPTLIISKLTVCAGEKVILNDISLRLGPCSLVALVGPMGGGKSTLLKVLAGEAEREGLDVTGDIAHLPRTKVAPITHFIRQKVRDATRSTSERRKEIAEKLAAGKGILCIDEPTAGLKAEDASRVMQDLAEAAQKRLVIMVTHNMAETAAYADRVVLLAGSRVIEDLPKTEFVRASEGTAARRFQDTGGLILADENATGNQRSPELRDAPDGLQLEETPAGESFAWVLQGKLCVTGATDTDFPTLLIRESAAEIKHNDQTLFSYQWRGGYNRPDQDLPTVLELSGQICDLINAGATVAVDRSFAAACGAAVVAAVILRLGADPALAFEAIALRFPELHLGMRLEQLIWDMDLELSLSTAE